VIELCSFLTIGAAQGKSFTLSHVTIDPRSAGPWAAAAVLLAGGGVWLRYAIGGFGAAWATVTEEIKATGMRA
jgi:branched-chain amino acid transport system permease protein